MLYYIIRLVIIIVLVTSVLLKNKCKAIKINASSTLIKRRKLDIKSVSKILIFIFLTAVIFFPYESYFIRFSSPKKSVLYSVPSSFNSDIVIVEENNAAFILLQRGNNYSYHSSTKYKDGYGFCDYQTKIKSLYQPQYVNSEKFKGVISLSTVYNKTTNTTLYSLDFIGDIYDNNFKITDNKNNEYVLLDEAGNNTIFFYTILKGAPEQNIDIIVDRISLCFS